VKLPRDLSGEELAGLLGRFGYVATRQTGSHIRLTSQRQGHPHNITVPAHKSIKSGTLASILRDVSSYLKMSKSDLQGELFS